ncbi:hypothetical protein PR202_ga28717 [Eleusine coracana subsp. coracana]|uniref:Uncharacterized protein n=1 Tax=Eleusine coracana subsp. coracana TaxID=191504 RepID=A0AAV5DJV7_ELECO|nr:hypothetical protein PR202_ga28717 [Eleusine coracana subsp. coracana]
MKAPANVRVVHRERRRAAPSSSSHGGANQRNLAVRATGRSGRRRCASVMPGRRWREKERRRVRRGGARRGGGGRAKERRWWAQASSGLARVGRPISSAPAGQPCSFVLSSPILQTKPGRILHHQMAPSYRPYAAEYGSASERKPAVAGRWVAWCGLGSDSAEMKRRRRVAGYKAYAVEGKMKASVRRGIRWIKAKCSHIIHH